MNDFDPSQYDPSSEVRRNLQDAVENEKNITLAIGNSPLTRDRLNALKSVDENVVQVAERFGWPSDTDEIMDPIVDLSPSAFLDSLIEMDEYGLRHIRTTYFYRTLEQEPVDLPYILAPDASSDSFIGTLPVMHRAYALAPDLFSNTRDVLRAYRKEMPRLSNEDEMYTELTKPKNADVVLAISMCYRIMGRLLTVDDGKIWRQLCDGDDAKSEEAAPFLSADIALRSGNYL